MASSQTLTATRVSFHFAYYTGSLKAGRMEFLGINSFPTHPNQNLEMFCFISKLRSTEFLGMLVLGFKAFPNYFCS